MDTQQVVQKRQYSRITYVVEGTLTCRNASYACRLENLSKGGALVTIRAATNTDIHIGDTCLFSLFHDIEDRHIVIEARVAHHVFAFVGLAFHNLDSATMESLETIVEREKYNSTSLPAESTNFTSY